MSVRQDCLQLIMHERVQDVKEVGAVDRSALANLRWQIITHLRSIMVDRPKSFHGYFWVVADGDRLQLLQRAELLLAIEDLAYPFLVEL